MPATWFQPSALRTVALLGGLLLILSGCHFHHRGHAHYGGGYHGGHHGGYERGHRGGGRFFNRGFRRGGHSRGGWRGRH